MTSFLEATANLESAVAELGYVATPGCEIWEESVANYIRFLAARLVTADNSLAEGEFRALEAYNADGTTYHEEMELARHFAMGAGDLLERPPAFLLTAWERDPSVARRIRDAIHHLVYGLVRADGHAHIAEVRMAVAYLHLEGLVGGPHSEPE